MQTKFKNCAFIGLMAIAALGFTISSCHHQSAPEPDDDTDDTTAVPESLIAMVRINAGTFTMGSPENEPGRNTTKNRETQHQVTLTKGFYIGKFQITQAQYREVMGSNPSSFKTSASGDDPNKRPVDSACWYDAIEFCNALSTKEELTPYYTIDKTTKDPNNMSDYDTVKWTVTANASANGYRLPTEAQWEYACRAGTTTAFNWGTDTIDDTQANYDASKVDANNLTAGTYLYRTTEVGTYAPNAWDLYDMHGNVFEWCWDWYDVYTDDAQTDPAGPVSGSNRVFRGGYWSCNGSYARSAYRLYVHPSVEDDNFGFRVVRPLEE